MSDVVDAVEKSFRAIVLENKPYRSITVKEICEGAYISRRTFYANFVDKRAVVAYLFRCDAVNPVKRVLELVSVDEALGMAPDIIARFYQGIYDDREFWSALVKPMRWIDSTFERVVVRAVSKMLEDGIMKANPNANKALVSYSAEYHANALALMLEKWIYENYETPVEHMASRQASVLVPNLMSLL